MAGVSGPGAAAEETPQLPEVESRAAAPEINLVDEPRAGWASYYADRFQGRKTANGERFDHQAMTAASNQFSLGAQLAVRRMGADHCVLVRVNDRMARRHGWLRVLDLTKLAATQLQMLQNGVVQVQVQRVEGEGLSTAAACQLAFGITINASSPVMLVDDMSLHPPAGEPVVPGLAPEQ